MLTFQYDCRRCGSHDELSPAGGALSCRCATGAPEDLFVTKVTDGEAQDPVSFAEICGITC